MTCSERFSYSRDLAQIKIFYFDILSGLTYILSVVFHFSVRGNRANCNHLEC